MEYYKSYCNYCKICSGMGDYNHDYTYKSIQIINEIWKILESLQDKLHDFGLYISLENKYIIIDFNYEKISETSFIKKHKIYKGYLLVSPNYLHFEASIKLLSTELLSEIDDKISIDYMFPVKSFLIHLFKIIGIDIFDRYLDYVPTDISIDIDTIINNLKDHKNYEEYKNNLIKLNIHKIDSDKNIKWKKETNISVENYKKEFNQLIEEKEKLSNELSDVEKDENNLLRNIFLTKKETIKLLENIKDKDKKYMYDIYLKTINDIIKDDLRFSLENEINIKKKIKDFFDKERIMIDKILVQKEIQHRKIIIETIQFEKTLFPEIFNFEINKSEISENIDIYNKKYIYMTSVIGKYLQDENSFEILEKEIKHYLMFVIETNFY